MIKEEYEPIISIIILNWNGKKYIKKCINSILKSVYKKEKLEIIMIDNASIDGSYEIVMNNYKEINVIRNDVNLGYCIGNNIGIKNAKGDIIILLNNDTEVNSMWLKEIVEIIKCSNIGVVGCQLIIAESKIPQQSFFILHGSGRGIAINEAILYNVKSCSKKKFQEYSSSINNDFVCKNVIKECDWVNGAAFAFSKEVFNEIGLLDNALTPDHEDKDICWRAKKAGFKVMMAENSKVIHYVSQSWKFFSLRRILLSEINRLLFVYKHFNGLTLFNSLFYYEIQYWIFTLLKFIKGKSVFQKRIYEKPSLKNIKITIAFQYFIRMMLSFLFTLIFPFICMSNKITRYEK